MRPHAYAIRAARKACNLSLDRVQELTGIDKGQLSKVENGKAGLSDLNIHKLAEVYGVPHTAITHDDHPQEKP
ncbi:helix-turn-helix transcriptional regulator [Streptomyces sp. NPDC094143]|uniref:helix-turn-helix domain-containing protein n=1 Tax=Streptomyces sp. NPDC094143 TaxID=3155310 RepID=UPI00331CA5B7